MAKVLIADDHALVRAGLRQFLQDSGRFSTIAEAGSGTGTMKPLRLFSGCLRHPGTLPGPSPAADGAGS